jgi:hypothetical protein
VPAASRYGGFGQRVALSADGRTAHVGAPGTDDQRGAAWVFVRSGNRWIRNTAPLTARVVPPGDGAFGTGVAVSRDGSVALIGAFGRGIGQENGAAWPFRRAG